MGDKDRAFRNFLSDKVLFFQFLRRFLRFGTLEGVGLEDIELENVSFISQELVARESDVLYRIRRGGKETYIYILVEHQSSVDHLMPFRLLAYMVRIWERCVEEAGSKSRRKSYLLPPVIPVVFYDGMQKWTVASTFVEKVENGDAFAGFVPNFSYHLMVLGKRTSEELLAFRDALGGLLYLANPSKEEDLSMTVRRLLEYRKLLPLEEREILSRHFAGYLTILAKREGVDLSGMAEEIASEEEAEKMVTYVQREIRKIRKEGRLEGREEGRMEGRMEGRQEGRQEGRMEGRQEAMQESARKTLESARKMLSRGFDAAQVADVLDLPLEQVRALAESEGTEA